MLTGATGYIGHTWLTTRASRGRGRRLLQQLARGARTAAALGGQVAGVRARRRLRRGRAARAARAPPHRRRGALCRLQGGGRVDGPAPGLLPQQPRRPGRRLRSAARHGCRRFVFSSSATVYGDPQRLPITEDAPLSATNPYGQTKLIGETLLRRPGRADPLWQTACLRYFNPVGAHESAADRRRPARHAQQPDALCGPGGDRPAPLSQVFGNDYPTPDGTGVRDYIHVVDLAEGHVAALRGLLDTARVR
jgi:hypothetical protein